MLYQNEKGNMSSFKFFYDRFNDNCLLDLLNNPEVQNNIAYMMDFKTHHNLKTTPHPNSIEISNDDITIVFLSDVHFKKNEYEQLAKKNNIYYLSFNYATASVVDFEGIPIHVINNLSLLFTILSRSNNEYAHMLNCLIHI